MIDSLIALYERSTSYDGYEREIAVRALGELGDTRFLSALLIRANDWVPEVRAAAREALERFLTPKYAPSWINNLPELYRLETCSRDDHTWLIDRVETLLLQPECRPLLEAGSRSTVSQRGCFHILERYQLLTREQLIAVALDSYDIVLKRKTAHWIETEASVNQRLLVRCLSDSYSSVRRTALRRLAVDYPDAAEPYVRAALVDRAGIVRDSAGELIPRYGNSSATVYRQILTNPESPTPHIRRALLAMQSIGATTDVPAIQPFQAAEYQSVRDAAFRALVSLDDRNRRATIIAALGTTSGVGLKWATRMAARHGVAPQYEELEQLIGRASDTGNGPAQYNLALNRLVRIARLGNKWDELYFLLSELSGYRRHGKRWWPEEPRVVILWELQRWIARFNRCQVPPKEEQCKRLREPIAVARRFVDEGITDTLHWYVYGTRP